MKKVILAVVILAVAGAIGWTLKEHMDPKEPNPSIQQVQEEQGVPVEIVTVQPQHLDQWREFTGTVEGIRQATVFTNVAARVKSIAKEVGDPVRKGEVVVRLDPESGSQTGTMYEKAKLDLESAQRAYSRIKNLYEAGAVSKADFEAAEDGLKLARQALQDTNLNLDLTAPIAGVVTKILTEVGTNAEAGAALAVVADTSEVKVKLDVSTDEVRMIEVGQTARCARKNGNGRCAMGKVTKVALSADEMTRLFAVEVTMDNADGGIRAGVIETVKVLVGQSENALAVPEDALIQSGVGMSVWVVQSDDTAKKVPVTIGMWTGDRVEIKSGLKEGDRVVSYGFNLLRDGVKVLVREAKTS